MDNWELDRIYNWLGSALGHNTTMNRKFYFDFSDKVFFNLIENKKGYSLWDKKTYSPESMELLISKISKVINSDPSILEIKKSKKQYSHLLDSTTSYENYTKKEEEWKSLFEEIKSFFDTNSIIIEQTRLIE